MSLRSVHLVGHSQVGHTPTCTAANPAFAFWPQSTRLAGRVAKRGSFGMNHMKTAHISYWIFLAAALLGSTRSSAGADAARKAPAMEPRISVITLGVADLNRSFRFYKDGLGFPTKMTPDGGIVLFATSGSRMFIYPYAKLAKDVGIEAKCPADAGSRFAGVTFGHCVRKKELVDEVLKQAEAAGGKIVKPAREASWGGYSGYFSDPDGYLWEVAYSDQWVFNPDGSLRVDE